MPHLNEMAQKYRPDEVIFLAISMDYSANEARSFLKQKKLNNIYTAMDDGAGDKLDAAWIPYSYIIGSDGKVVWQGHPQVKEFEQALQKAVKNAPPAFLKGVDLGPFENLRFQLSGFRGFPRAYRTLRVESRKDKSKNAALAAKIIDTVDKKIESQIEQIRSKQNEDPQTALSSYRELISKFKGAEPMEKAETEYEKLQENMRNKNEPQTIRD
jgi:hypothetical protein